MSGFGDARRLGAAALLGIATGLRSQIGLATILNVGGPRPLPSFLKRRFSRLGTGVAAAGELVADKLPGTPTRTQAPGLALRLVLGGLNGALVGGSEPTERAGAVTIGCSAAVLSAYAGQAVRKWAAGRVPPIVAALTEDCIAVTLAVAGVRLAQSAEAAEAAEAADSALSPAPENT